MLLHLGVAPSRRSSKDDNQVSPTSTTAGGARFTLSPGSATSNSSSYHRDHRLMSDFSNYRRDLAVLETSGGRPIPQIQHNPPTAVSISQVAPWMTSSNGGSSTPSSGHLGGGGSGGGAGGSLAYYNDSTDNLSLGSQLSPGFRSGGHGRSVQTPNSNNDSPDIAYFGDERRPSLASVTTASSQGSRSSTNRGGLRKLQGFFGEEFPGRDGAIDTPTHGHQGQLPPVPGKEHRSHSYSNHHRPHRERNFSNATDHGRESSPSGSRPRTPLPSSDVVPFLYQEVDVRGASDADSETLSLRLRVGPRSDC